MINLFENIHKLDRFELVSKLDQLLVDVSNSDATTEKLRNLLRKVVLEEILKSSDIADKSHFASRLQVVIDLLNSEGNVNGYPCAFSGCRYQADRHRSYIIHIKKCHPTMKDIECNFKKICKQRFVGSEELVNHIKTKHAGGGWAHPPAPVAGGDALGDEINISCKCNRLSCQGVVFPSVRDLMKHWNSYHSTEERDCIFLGCSTTFSSPGVGRNHFLIKHQHMRKMNLKTGHIIEANTRDNVESSPVMTETQEFPGDSFEFNDDSYNVADLADIENVENVIETDAEKQAAEDYYMFYYAGFLNRLTNFKYIPQTTVTDIADEYLSNTRKSLKQREFLLRNSLKSIPNISQLDIEKIVLDVLGNDNFLNAQIALKSEYKRTKFVQENMQYVGPDEIVLNEEEIKQGKKKDVLHFVKISEC